jgi:hypothetical protein
MATKRKPILREYMRDSFEEFAEILCEEIYRKNPKQHKMVKEIKDAMKRVIEEEFGEDPGGIID